MARRSMKSDKPFKPGGKAKSDYYQAAARRRLADQRHLDGKKSNPIKGPHGRDAAKGGAPGAPGVRHQQIDIARLYDQNVKKPEPDDKPLARPQKSDTRRAAARRARLEGIVL